MKHRGRRVCSATVSRLGMGSSSLFNLASMLVYLQSPGLRPNQSEAIDVVRAALSNPGLFQNLTASGHAAIKRIALAELLPRRRQRASILFRDDRSSLRTSFFFYLLLVIFSFRLFSFHRLSFSRPTCPSHFDPARSFSSSSRPLFGIQDYSGPFTFSCRSILVSRAKIFA